MLESENRLLKDDIANKQRFIEILINFNESNIQSRHNKNTLPSIIQKNANTDSNNTIHEKKDKQRIKDALPIKYGTPVLENEVATENVAKQSEVKANKEVVTVNGDSMIKNLNNREISTINSVKIRSNLGATTADLLDHVKPAARKKQDMLVRR